MDTYAVSSKEVLEDFEVFKDPTTTVTSVFYNTILRLRGPAPFLMTIFWSNSARSIG